MTTPAPYRLMIYRGDSYAWQFNLWSDCAKTMPVDLTGCTPAAEIRTVPGGTLLLTMATTVTLPNSINMTLTAAQSHSLPVGSSSWDLELDFITASAVSTILSGGVYVVQDVTHSTP
jgi:hypothetical protein